MVAEGLEIRLVGDAVEEAGVEVQGRAKLVEGPGRIAGEGPVAGEIVVEEGLLGVLAAGSQEGVDRLGETVGALVAPAQADGDADVVGPEHGSEFQGLQGVSISTESAERLAGQEAGFELDSAPLGPGLQECEGVLGQVKHEVALGLIEVSNEAIPDS